MSRSTNVDDPGYASLVEPVRKRTSHWELPGAEERLNPLGRRILTAWLRTGLTMADFAAAANIPRSAIDVLFRRLGAGVEKSNVSMEVVVGIARAAGVSLVWLATGEGTMLTGPFAEHIDKGMQRFSDELIRAVHAAIALTQCTRGQAIRAAELALEEYGNVHRTADAWLTSIRHHIEKMRAESGERPSVRGLRAQA